MDTYASNVVDHPVTVRLRQCRRLASVLEKTRVMLNAAKEDEWEEVARLETTRRQDFIACFEYEIAEGDSHLLSEGIATLLSLNEELMGDLQRAKDRILRENTDLNTGFRAAGHYLDIGRLES